MPTEEAQVSIPPRAQHPPLTATAVDVIVATHVGLVSSPIYQLVSTKAIMVLEVCQM